MLQAIKSLLAEPDTRGLAIDDPETTTIRRKIVREKKFLRGIYEEWYERVAGHLPREPGAVLELGSGAGFLDEYIPGLITSEVFHCPHIGVVLDARRIPFPAQSLRAIVMTDVLHHVPCAQEFFAEADRCLVPGGAILMVEPWVTAWSKLIYRNLHHEPFEPGARDWTFPQSGPLSGANGALPWIIFERDRAEFHRQYPNFAVARIEPMMPLRYLISGGVSLRCVAPAASFGLWRGLEGALSPWRSQLAMFAFIVISKRSGQSGLSPAASTVSK